MHLTALHLFIIVSVWGYVDHGLSPNVQQWLEKGRKKGNVTRITVSRSHAGSVEKTVRSSIRDVLVIPAGGAGIFL
jgi:hypothetical protein